MVVIQPIFTTDGKTNCCHFYISRAEPVANFNRSFVASLIVVEFEIIVSLKIFPSSYGE